LLTTYCTLGTSQTNAAPSYTYLEGTASDLVFNSGLYSATTPWTVQMTMVGNTPVGAPAAGWAAPVTGPYLGTVTDLQTERLTRLGKATVTIHFLSEYDLYLKTGIVDQLDLLTGHTAAPALAPSPSSETVNGTKLWTWVNTDYSYYPFSVTVTWVPTSSQVHTPQQTKSISILGVAYPPMGRAQ